MNTNNYDITTHVHVYVFTWLKQELWRYHFANLIWYIHSFMYYNCDMYKRYWCEFCIFDINLWQILLVIVMGTPAVTAIYKTLVIKTR